MNYAELLQFLAPESIVTLAVFAVLIVDLTTLRGSPVAERMRSCAWLTVLGCAAGALALYLVPAETPPGYLDGMLALSPLTRVVKLAILALSACTALLALEVNFTEHVSEFFALLLLATLGMMFLVSTENLLLIFIALELLSLSLYVMTAFNKQNIASAEAALKYFLIGGISAAVLLFGFSLIYGVTGTLNLRGVAQALAGKPMDPLTMVAIVMVTVGLGFKVAAAPFHLWAPDAYQGAPIPAAALIASGSKVASFFILAKLMMAGFAGESGSGAWRQFSAGWVPMMALLAVASLVVGNLAALVQRSVRRLLAYSAIAQAGYMLVGLAADSPTGLNALLYYVITYAATTVGAFGVVALVEAQTGRDDLGAFAGLRQRSPLAAVCLLIFLLSLAGIPPLAGFFGKFYIFAAVLKSGDASLGLLWLVVLAIGMSAVSLYYYLQVLKRIYVAPTDEGAGAIKVSIVSQVALGVLAALVVLLGCLPDLLLNWLQQCLTAAGF